MDVSLSSEEFSSTAESRKPRYRLLIVDDHRLISETISAAMIGDSRFEVLKAETIAEATQEIKRSGKFDIILLDYKLPDSVGLKGLQIVLKANNGRVALFSGATPVALVERALELGAQGFVPKSIRFMSLVHAFELMLAGEKFVSGDVRLSNLARFEMSHQLTHRQIAVIELMRDGLGNKEIANELGVSVVIVGSDLRSIRKKLGVTGRTQIVAEVEKLGII